MASIQPSVDYTDRDLAALRTRYRALIKSVFPAWTDFSVANFGQLLADLSAWTGDVLGFAQDAQANEAFIPTAVQRRSLLKLAAQIGYKPVGASAASTALTFTATGLVADCIIPAGTLVKTLDVLSPIEFQTLSPITLFQAGPATATVTVENSKSVSESFASTGQPNFSIQLGQSPYLDLSLSLTTAQGLFTEVLSFVNAGPSDKVFTVKVDDNDRATVTFGDGVVAGLIPTGTLTCSYKIGGGKLGNAAAGSILAIEGTLTDIHGATANVSCTNALAATGGTDRESAGSIRTNAPASITAPAVSVARKDFEVNAKRIGGIDRALYVTANEDPNIPVNTGHLFLVSPGVSGPDYADGNHMDQVRRQFVRDDDTAPYPMMATQLLTIFPAPFIDVDIYAKVFLKRNAVAATVKAAINAALVSFFATTVTASDGTVTPNPLIDFAYYLRTQSASTTPVGLLAASDVENVIRDVVGVREIGPGPADFTLTATRRVSGAIDNVNQAAARQDILMEFAPVAGTPSVAANFPRLGIVTLYNGDTLAAL